MHGVFQESIELIREQLEILVTAFQLFLHRRHLCIPQRNVGIQMWDVKVP